MSKKNPALDRKLRFIDGAKKLAEREKLTPTELINIMINTAAAAAYMLGYSSQTFTEGAEKAFSQVEKEIAKDGTLS